MNALGLLLTGGIVRVTVLACLGVALGAVLRRRGPAAGSLVSLATLSGLVAVSALSLTPWPRLWTLNFGRHAAVNGEDSGGAPTARLPSLPTVSAQAGASGDDAWASGFVREFLRELRGAPVSPTAPEGPSTAGRWRWPAVVAAGVMVVWAVALARLALALRAVNGLRRRGRPLDDPGVLAEVEALRAELSLTRGVDTRVCDELVTPATVGWLRPVVLLPPEWRGWTAPERHAVLAHELAHVRRGDYLWGLWAQFCLAWHAYHPVAHWLVARLRLDQELVADAWGARLSGGNRPYLESLARLALRRSEAPPAWPVRPFLPSRNAFLRRIEMLRDAKTDPVRTGFLPPLARWVTAAAFAAAALGVAGLRAPAPANAQAPGPDDLKARQKALQDQLREVQEALEQRERAAGKGAGKFSDPFDLSRAPAGTVAVIVGKPAALLTRPEFKPVLDILKQQPHAAHSINVPFEEVEWFSAFFLRREDRPGAVDPMIVMRATRPQDWKAVAGTFIGQSEEVKHAGRVYTRAKTGPVGQVTFTPDDRTIVVGLEPEVLAAIDAIDHPAAPVRHTWDDAWSRVKKGQVAVAVDPSWFAALAQSAPKSSPLDPSGAFSPLFDKVTGYAASLNLDAALTLDAVATCPSDESVRLVEDTLKALVTLGRNAVQGMRNQPGVAGGAARSLDAALLMLDSARTTREGRTVSLRSAAGVSAGELVNAVLLPVVAARTAARRSQAANNMKQILLAMHNYHAMNDHFPPAVGRSPDGRVPHSWRVALLPYLEQESLYKQYDFTETWDSPKNRKVLEQMPAVYRDPSDARPGFFTSYFVPTGPDTVFPPGGTGTKLSEIIDGTSNTVAVIEAKREVPWTKPDDIPVTPSPDRSVPEFGGFYQEGGNLGFADGSVRFVSSRVDPVVLRNLLTKAGGEVVTADVIRPPQGRGNQTPPNPNSRPTPRR